MTLRIAAIRTIRLSSLALLLACPQRAYVWIEQGSSASHLLFRIGRSEGRPGGVSIGVFRVDPCDVRDGSKAMWILGDDTSTDNTDVIEYGRPPVGFSVEQAPRPLAPGCYEATVGGSPGSVTFDVAKDGSVQARPSTTH